VRVTTVTCDRCGQTIRADLVVIKFLAVQVAPAEADLCPDCGRQLPGRLRRGPAPEASKMRARWGDHLTIRQAPAYNISVGSGHWAPARESGRASAVNTRRAGGKPAMEARR
jgi:hypothetical protein